MNFACGFRARFEAARSLVAMGETKRLAIWAFPKKHQPEQQNGRAVPDLEQGGTPGWTGYRDKLVCTVEHNPEPAVFPLLCRGAALRFFLTRLVDWTDTPPDALVRPKNPMAYAARLAFHRKAVSAADYGA